MRATYKKFSTGFWSQSLRQKTHKTREYSEAWQSFRSLIFKNLLESHFCFNKKCFAGRMVLIQCALHFVGQMIYFTYRERMYRTYKKFSMDYWSQKTSPKKAQNWDSETLPSFRIFYYFVLFLAKTLTSKVHRKFFIRRIHTFLVCKTYHLTNGT